MFVCVGEGKRQTHRKQNYHEVISDHRLLQIIDDKIDSFLECNRPITDMVQGTDMVQNISSFSLNMAASEHMQEHLIAPFCYLETLKQQLFQLMIGHWGESVHLHC